VEIVNKRPWDGGIEGEEITLKLPLKDRLVIHVLGYDGNEDATICEVSIQSDGAGRAEISLINGNVTFYT
jgi:hypothetical protein